MKSDLIEFTGDNAEYIAEQMTLHSRQSVMIGEIMDDGTLSLDQLRGDQQLADRWRVPVGCFMNRATGEVTDKGGVPVDYAELVKGTENGNA